MLDTGAVSRGSGSQSSNREKVVRQKVNALAYFIKEKPKNVLSDEGIAAVAEVYRRWETRPRLSRVITLAEARAANYNLSPAQFVEIADKVQHRSLPTILADLDAARIEREEADEELAEVLVRLGLNGQP